MNTQHHSTLDLLSTLVGKRLASKLARIPLSVLFEINASRPIVAENGAEYAALPSILAAKTLITRALAENLQQDSVVFNNPQTTKDYLRLLMGGYQHEVFLVLFLDTQHRVIAEDEMFRGTLSQTSVYPREIIKRALQHNAAAVILAHNHPSGNANPSLADRNLTDLLTQTLNMVDIRVLDHMVIGAHEVLSFAENGWLPA